MLWLHAFVVCSCVRAGFEAPGRSGTDAAVDVAAVADVVDDASGELDGDASGDAGPCRSWGPFSAPVKLTEVNTGYDDWAPVLGAGGRQLVLASYRPGGTGDSDIWQYTRAAPDQPFAAPQPVAAVNSTSYECCPVLSADGLTLIFGTDRRTPLTEVFIAERKSPGDAFGPPAPLDAVNDNITRPQHLSADGLTLWLTSHRNIGRSDVFVATRTAPGAPFSTPVLVPSLSSSENEHSVTLTRDGLEAIFSSNRAGGKGKQDIWLARRSGPDADFGTAENLAALNTSWDDTFVALSPDGSTLYFNRDTSLSGGRDADVWVAHRTCLDR